MAMICSICSLNEGLMGGPLLPYVVVYRGYSLCTEHLHLWEANRGMEWSNLLKLSRPKPPSEDILEGDHVPKWVAEKMADIPDPEEDEFGGSLRPDFVGDTEAVTQHEKPKPRRNRKSKKKKGGKKK